MRKRCVNLLAATVVAVLGGVIWWAAATRPPTVPDPVYAGHPLSYWLSPSAMTGGAARGEMQYFQSSLNSNAVPDLVQALKAREGTMRLAYERLWPHFPVWLRQRAPNPTADMYARETCCYFLGQLGTAARPAIPELVRVLREDDSLEVRFAACVALANVANGKDKQVVDALTTAWTKDTDAHVRALAGGALNRIDPDIAIKAGVTNAAPGTSP